MWDKWVLRTIDEFPTKLEVGGPFTRIFPSRNVVKFHFLLGYERTKTLPHLVPVAHL